MFRLDVKDEIPHNQNLSRDLSIQDIVMVAMKMFSFVITQKKYIIDVQIEIEFLSKT